MKSVSLASLDAEIKRLEKVRSLLLDAEYIRFEGKPGRGRPKRLRMIPVAVRKRGAMAEEVKAKISAAQRKRWAALTKAKQ